MSADLTTLLERLLAAEVEVVLVGGLAAVVQGAPVTTFDVDVGHVVFGFHQDRQSATVTLA
jgi:hypothetical protein